jgi:hypothetical protein
MTAVANFYSDILKVNPISGNNVGAYVACESEYNDLEE